MNRYAAILAYLLRLPVYAEDREDPRKAPQIADLATAIGDAAGESRTLAALEIAHGFEESGWSLRIHDGHCRSWECDHGRARGPWQLWQNSMPQERWELMRGLGHTRKQAEAAKDRILLGLRQCDGSVAGSIARYFGLSCDDRSPRVLHRYGTYRRAWRALAQPERVASDAVVH